MPDKEISITPELQESIDALDKLSNELFSRIDQLKLDATQITNRVKVTLAMLAAQKEYAESVRILAAQFKSKSAIPILRSMLEGQQTLSYILQIPGESRVLAAAAAEAAGTASNLRRISQYMEKNGLQKFGSYKLEDVLELAVNKEDSSRSLWEEVDRVADGELTSKSGFPGLAQRAQKFDELSNSPDKTRTNYYTYLSVYTYMSGGAHLGIDGLAEWINESSDQFELNANETPELAQKTVYSAFALLGDIAITAMRELQIEDVDFENWIRKTAGLIAPALN